MLGSVVNKLRLIVYWSHVALLRSQIFSVHSLRRFLFQISSSGLYFALIQADPEINHIFKHPNGKYSNLTSNRFFTCDPLAFTLHECL